MLLDFITSRWMMMVGGLLLAAAAASLYTTFTAVPEQVNFERWAEDWAAPIVDAYKGTGTLGAGGEGRRIEFTQVDTINIRRDPYYREKGFQALIYRDAVVLEFKGRDVRIDLPGADRTHLWYATNAATYGATEQSNLDRVAPLPLVVDFDQDLLIQRGPNATGVQQIYIYQSYVEVTPSRCVRVEYEPASFGKQPTVSCTEGALFRVVDSRGIPLPVEMTADYDESGLSLELVPNPDEAIYLIEGEPRPIPAGAPGLRRFYLYSQGILGAALTIDYRIERIGGSP